MVNGDSYSDCRNQAALLGEAVRSVLLFCSDLRSSLSSCVVLFREQNNITEKGKIFTRLPLHFRPRGIVNIKPPISFPSTPMVVVGAGVQFRCSIINDHSAGSVRFAINFIGKNNNNHKQQSNIVTTRHGCV